MLQQTSEKESFKMTRKKKFDAGTADDQLQELFNFQNKYKIPEDAPPGIIISTDEPDKKKDNVIYIVSDLHMGVHTKNRIIKTQQTNQSVDVISDWNVDKSDSNLFDKYQASKFVKWLEFIENELNELSEKHQNKSQDCHLIINGDFLDLWQAKAPTIIPNLKVSNTDDDNLTRDIPYSYKNRIDEIFDMYVYRYTIYLDYNEDGQKMIEGKGYWDVVCSNPNYKVLQALLRFACGKNRKVIYLIGNHDDPLYTGNNDNDPAYGNKPCPNAEILRQYLIQKLDGIRKNEGLPEIALSNIQIGRFYWNREIGVYAEHGHIFDKENWKQTDSDGCLSQHFNEGIFAELKETTGIHSLRYVDNVPHDEIIKYLKCLARYKITKWRHYNKLPAHEKSFQKIAEKILLAGSRIEGGLWKMVIAEFLDLITPADEFIKMGIDELEHFSKMKNEKYMDKAALLAKITGTQVLTFGHTHNHNFRRSKNWVYVNTGEWITNVKFVKSRRRLRTSHQKKHCKLIRNNEGEDHYLKIYTSSDENMLSVQLDCCK